MSTPMVNSRPAFPCEHRFGDGTVEWSKGMTLREHYAGLAMQGLLACPVQPQSGAEMYARDAVMCADALIAELAKEPK